MNYINKKKLSTALMLALITYSANAFSTTEDKDIKKIEDYLNSIKSMRANFVQIASNGDKVEGQIYIEKPNKIRMEYNAPSNILIVGNGDYIVYYDKELDQITNIDYDDIPATLILANDIKIDGKKIKVLDFYQDSGSTTITLDYADKGDLGPITLVFSNNPMELKQWKIVDPQSVEVSVSLYDAKKDQPLDEKIFKFKEKKSGAKGYKKKR